MFGRLVMYGYLSEDQTLFSNSSQFFKSFSEHILLITWRFANNWWVTLVSCEMVLLFSPRMFWNPSNFCIFPSLSPKNLQWHYEVVPLFSSRQLMSTLIPPHVHFLYLQFPICVHLCFLHLQGLCLKFSSTYLKSSQFSLSFLSLCMWSIFNLVNP